MEIHQLVYLIHKNSTDISEAVKKVQNAVVSVITYAESSSSVINDESSNDESQISSEGSGVIYKKTENQPIW